MKAPVVTDVLEDGIRFEKAAWGLCDLEGGRGVMGFSSLDKGLGS